MDLTLITGDQADHRHLNETVWVRELLEGKGPTHFNPGVTDPSFYRVWLTATRGTRREVRVLASRRL